jgi:two-component system cell cycle sensor histidine kinase/response regulator CckA
MPFMDGAATILALRKIKPDIKVIVMSDHERRQEMEADRRVNADAFIEKPFTVEKLLTAVRDMLAK